MAAMNQIAPGVFEGGQSSVPAREEIKASAFWDRFTNAELVSYDVAMQHDPAATAGAQRAAARLRIFRREVSDAGRLNLSRQKVSDFLASLESAGVIAPGRASAILSAPIRPYESA